MNKFFTDILTGADNKSYDIGRVSYAIGVVVFVFGEISKMFFRHDFNGMEFCGGLGTLITLSSGGLLLKARTEPKVEKDNAITQ